ncbi:2-succinyl-5-enolpyruvyl-6-hydroxy-3-cyclohexene- 1-carboxylic-acid synthase [Fodinibacter luteus]|uniref:2-succinyl-5-enolpyruvyl-6-hydroxy-3-cyclohexene-1-carboxylate synthase n=1 Tax=Fodinibacter luteus TaxID=552064 RepID=A0ABP8KQ65_9MICO
MTPSSALAVVLVDELVRNGVRDVVLCPGSRSAPLAYAVLDAERSRRIRLHVRVDERSAGFLALGLALASGSPVAVVTTSGTAVANLHPAVLEAHHAGVPLLVVSADRPHELRGTGANQTTAQPGLFGSAVRWSADLPAPVIRPGLPPFWRSTVCRAVAAALGTVGTAGSPGALPGPVHLNVSLREPLVPDAVASRWPDSLDGRPDDAPWVSVTARAAQPAGPDLPALERTLVVVGRTRDPRVAERAVAWAAERGHPVVAEPFGPRSVRSAALPHGPLVLTATDWVERHLPDRVLVVGRVTLSRAVAALLRRPGVRVEVVSEGGPWPDPSHVAAAVHPPSVLASASGGVADHGPAVPSSTAADPRGSASHLGAWAQGWRRAGQALADAVAAEPFPWPSGLAVGGAVAASLPPDALLVLGSSNPVRDLDLAAPGPVAGDALANRGLAGIDGMVSTAVGAALAAPGRPAYALVGDLTFLHDANGLLVGPDEPTPDLTVVVVNDDGGGIFTTLEPGAPERAADFERVFGTPTGTDLAALCRAHGIRHDRADDRDEFAAALAARPAGIRVVEVRVDRASHRRAHAELRALAARTLLD